MHEASDAEHQAGAVPVVPAAPDAPIEAAEAAEASEIETLPLAQRAARYQEIADRLRGDLERSDPARGDA